MTSGDADVFLARSTVARSLIWAVVAFGICLAFWAIIAYLHWRTDVKYSFLYRDANAIAGNPFYYGILESLTAALMISSGSIIIFQAFSEKWDNSSPFWFCLSIGLLTVVMGLDDLLMLHESVWFLYWRLREIHVYIAYAALLSFSTLYFWRVFLETPFPLLAFALACLALAAVEDRLQIGFSIEDYLEIVGFSFWFCYILGSSVALKRRRALPV